MVIPKKIAIQGGYGAFHEIAALNYFENQEIEIIPRNTFKDLFQALKQGLVDYGITAIENSIAGSILPNYTLLLESNLNIIGEIYLRIEQNLVALPDQRIEDIREVHFPSDGHFYNACVFLMIILKSFSLTALILPCVQRKLPTRTFAAERLYPARRRQHNTGLKSLRKALKPIK